MAVEDARCKQAIRNELNMQRVEMTRLVVKSSGGNFGRIPSDVIDIIVLLAFGSMETRIVYGFRSQDTPHGVVYSDGHGGVVSLTCVGHRPDSYRGMMHIVYYRQVESWETGGFLSSWEED